MRIVNSSQRFTLSLSSLVLLFALASGCSRSYDATIAGVAVPIPQAMARSGETPAEISLLGFGAGQATFDGTMDIDAIVEFYKKELPARGWQANMNLRSGGAMLAYGKDGKTLLIGAGKQADRTRLTLTVGGAAH